MIAFPIAGLGIASVVLGWKDLADDLGASHSPIGLVLLGFALLQMWFQWVRLRAVQAMSKLTLPRSEVIAHYNFLCRFTGASPLPTPAATSQSLGVPNLLNSTEPLPSGKSALPEKRENEATPNLGAVDT